MSFQPSAVLEVLGLGKSYGDRVAIREISFRVAPGMVYGLLGRNGAGKTTTLECILGLRRPDAGRIWLQGIDTEQDPVGAREHLGALLQTSALPDKITVREALALFGRFYRESVAVSELLAQYSLAEKADERFETLSGGQRQRVFLALAMLHRPRLVVLDEPTAGLDVQGRRELHAALRTVAKQGVAIVLSTHDFQEAETLCSRVGVLHGGTLVADDTPAAVIRSAGGHSRLRLRTDRPLDPERVRVEGIARITALDEQTLDLQGDNVAAALTGLTHVLQRNGIGIQDLQVRQPTLEDAFLALCEPGNGIPGLSGGRETQPPGNGVPGLPSGGVTGSRGTPLPDETGEEEPG